MPALTIPNIFFNSWFWLPIALPVVIILYFLRKKSPPPFPKTGKFFKNHKVAIRKVADVLLICMVLFFWLFPLSIEIDFYKSSSHPVPIQPEILQLEQTVFLMTLIFFSGQSGLFIGAISIFQKDLTKTKRVILLVACMPPIVFTTLLLLTNKTIGSWSIIRLCLYGSFLSWFINAPAIFLNKPFVKFMEDIVQKLKLLFGGQQI